jgi:hypothetical protein
VRRGFFRTRYGSPVDDPSAASLENVGTRIVAVLGEPAARELLDVLTRCDADRASLIGRLYGRPDARWLAEVLTDLEVDEIARLQLADALRRVLGPP